MVSQLQDPQQAHGTVVVCLIIALYCLHELRRIYVAYNAVTPIPYSLLPENPGYELCMKALFLQRVRDIVDGELNSETLKQLQEIVFGASDPTPLAKMLDGKEDTYTGMMLSVRLKLHPDRYNQHLKALADNACKEAANFMEALRDEQLMWKNQPALLRVLRRWGMLKDAVLNEGSGDDTNDGRGKPTTFFEPNTRIKMLGCLPALMMVFEHALFAVIPTFTIYWCRAETGRSTTHESS